MRIVLKFFLIFALLLVLTTISFVTYDFIRTRHAFAPKSFIAGIDVSFLNEKEAEKKLKRYPSTVLFAPLVTLEGHTIRYAYAPNNLGIHVLHKETVRHALSASRKSNYLEELKDRILSGEADYPVILGIMPSQLENALQELVDKEAVSPESSSITLDLNTGGYNISPEVIGKELNIQKSADAVKSAIASGKRSAALALDDIYPRVREEELFSHPPVQRISAYTTYYGKHDSPNRIHNIRLVSSWLDNKLMLPGDTLSLTELLGEVTEEQGFKEAFVIIKGELVPLLGGGSCQIATTLYNAVSLADLKILERRNHSFYFNIYPLGRDAAVYPGQVDFKFENDSPYPILIKTDVSDRHLRFYVYGTPSEKKVGFSPVKVLGLSDTGEYIHMKLKEVIEKEIPFKTEITRTVSAGGKKVSENIIRSYYKLYGDNENVPIKRPEPR